MNGPKIARGRKSQQEKSTAAAFDAFLSGRCEETADAVRRVLEAHKPLENRTSWSNPALEEAKRDLVAEGHEPAFVDWMLYRIEMRRQTAAVLLYLQPLAKAVQ